MGYGTTRDREGTRWDHGNMCVPVVLAAGRARQHPGAGPGRDDAPAARRGLAGGVHRDALIDVPERRPPLRRAAQRPGPPPPPPRRGASVPAGGRSSRLLKLIGGRRVVDGSGTAATGHERQEPHQLPAHPPLYLAPSLPL
jgi:hypothetical protein